MEISTYAEQDTTVVQLCGSLDAASTPEFRDQMDSLLDDGQRRFVLDFTAVEFVDSSGLGALVGSYKKVQDKKGTLKLAAVPKAVERVIFLTQLDRVLPISTSVQDAVGDAS